MRKFVYIVFLVLSIISIDLHAATYYSRNGGGNWDSRFSWTLNSSGSGAPAANAPLRTDNVIILNTHTIVVDATNDNGSTGISPNGLNLPNVGTFTASGTSCFYQSGDITVNSGGTLSVTTGMIIGGNTQIDGDFTVTGDVINTGNLIVSSIGDLTTNDDLILTGTSKTQLDNTANSFDDIYIDHTEARLCGDGVMNIGVSSGNSPTISYFNGATVAQICLGFTVSCGPDPGCSGIFPVSGTGGFSFDLSGFDYYKYITIRSDKVPGDLTNFPVLISYSDPDLRLVADGGRIQNANGYDIIFSSSNNCGNLSQLSHQLESYSSNGTAGTVVAWVNVPAVSSSTDTEIYMYYSNDSITSDQSLTSTFDYDHTNVYHFNNGDFNDASAWGNNSTNGGTANQGTSIIAGGRTFNTNDYISMPTADMISGSGTYSSWVYSTSFTGNHHYIIGHTTTPPYANRLQLYTNDAGGNLDLGFGNNHNLSLGIYNFNLNEWYHVALTWNSGTYNVYVNGALEDNGGYASFTTLQTFMDIGNDGNTGARNENWFGDIDEVNASRILRSSNWIETQYNNQILPDSFFNVGIELTNECIALPIELLSFTASISEGKNVLLNWSTASEINNDFFTVERSVDLKEWETIKYLKGAGNSRKKLTYNSVDINPLPGLSYYRLKQTDFNGKFEYSNVEAINFNTNQNISLFPNPAEDQLILSSSTSIDPRSIIVRTISGMQVDVPMKRIDNQIHFDITTLSNGLYFVQFSSNESISNLKFIKD